MTRSSSSVQITGQPSGDRAGHPTSGRHIASPPREVSGSFRSKNGGLSSIGRLYSPRSLSRRFSPMPYQELGVALWFFIPALLLAAIAYLWLIVKAFGVHAGWGIAV